MNIERLKQIPIVSVMARHGFDIVRQSGDAVFYFAPWRAERTASMKVSIKNNLFIDFGDDNYRGSVIDLVMHLSHCDLQNALGWLEMFSGNIRAAPTSKMDFNKQNARLKRDQPDIPPAFMIKNISRLEDKKIKEYILHHRSIDIDIAQQFLKQMEIEHNLTHKIHRVIGMENESGGWEIRGIHGNFKSCIGHKDFSFFDRKLENLLVVEGMFDLLSAITLEKQLQLPKTNYLVLHSLSMVEKARKTMEGYSQVLLALDSDNAGRKSAKLLLDLDNRYRDISFSMLQNQERISTIICVKIFLNLVKIG